MDHFRCCLIGPWSVSAAAGSIESMFDQVRGRMPSPEQVLTQTAAATDTHGPPPDHNDDPPPF
ncbi:hypothetical protein DDF83_02745 [Mycobacterium tuberculosis]|nr:hypothetical protein DDF83_02745 [Mycobacterium tuberculosis]